MYKSNALILHFSFSLILRYTKQFNVGDVNFFSISIDQHGIFEKRNAIIFFLFLSRYFFCAHVYFLLLYQLLLFVGVAFVYQRTLILTRRIHFLYFFFLFLYNIATILQQLFTITSISTIDNDS